MTKPQYTKISKAEVPANVRFDTPRHNDGQIVEVSYGGFSAAEHGEGDVYKRVIDHSDGQTDYYRLVAAKKYSITGHTVTTLVERASLPSGIFSRTDWAAENGIRLGDVEIPYTEAERLPIGEYRIVEARWGEHFSGAGYSGYHVLMQVERQ